MLVVVLTRLLTSGDCMCVATVTVRLIVAPVDNAPSPRNRDQH